MRLPLLIDLPEDYPAPFNRKIWGLETKSAQSDPSSWTYTFTDVEMSTTTSLLFPKLCEHWKCKRRKREMFGTDDFGELGCERWNTQLSIGVLIGVHVIPPLLPADCAPSSVVSTSIDWLKEADSTRSTMWSTRHLLHRTLPTYPLTLTGNHKCDSITLRKYGKFKGVYWQETGAIICITILKGR